MSDTTFTPPSSPPELPPAALTPPPRRLSTDVAQPSPQVQTLAHNHPTPVREDREAIYAQLLARANAEDLTDIDRLKLMFTCGVDRDGRPTLWVLGRNLPADGGSDVLERVFLYFLKKMDAMTLAEYNVVYSNVGVDRARNVPENAWLKKAYDELPRRFKKNLKRLIVVRPEFWMKAIKGLFAVLGLSAGKMGDKVTFVAKVCVLFPSLICSGGGAE